MTMILLQPQLEIINEIRNGENNVRLYMDNLSVDNNISEEYKKIKKKYRYTPSIVVWYFMKLGLLKDAPVGIKVPKDITPYQ